MATDYYQLRVQGLHQTEYNECVLHFRGVNLTAADYIPNAQNLLLAFQALVQSQWLAVLPASYQLLRLTAKKASPGGGGEQTGQYQFNAEPGAVAGGAAAQQLCPVIILIPPMGIKTAGKIFMPCIAESQIQANVVNSTWQADIATLMGTLITGFTDSVITWDLAIYSRKNASFSEVADYSLSPIVGFQRKRQRAPL